MVVGGVDGGFSVRQVRLTSHFPQINSDRCHAWLGSTTHRRRASNVEREGKGGGVGDTRAGGACRSVVGATRKGDACYWSDKRVETRQCRVAPGVDWEIGVGDGPIILHGLNWVASAVGQHDPTRATRPGQVYAGVQYLLVVPRALVAQPCGGRGYTIGMSDRQPLAWREWEALSSSFCPAPAPPAHLCRREECKCDEWHFPSFPVTARCNTGTNGSTLACYSSFSPHLSPSRLPFPFFPLHDQQSMSHPAQPTTNPSWGLVVGTYPRYARVDNHDLQQVGHATPTISTGCNMALRGRDGWLAMHDPLQHGSRPAG